MRLPGVLSCVVALMLPRPYTVLAAPRDTPPAAAAASPSVMAPTATVARAGKVVAVLAGDTLQVQLSPEGTEVRLRLFGVDTPDTNQAFGPAARDFVSGLALNKTVRVEPRGGDKNARDRNIVVLRLPDGVSLNEAVVKEGLAWWSSSDAPEERDSLGVLEIAARSARCGLWADPCPIPPWVVKSRSSRPIKATAALAALAAPASQKPTSGSSAPAAASETVYASANGKKYHNEDCPMLRGRGTALPLQDARNKGLEPCKVCNPE